MGAVDHTGDVTMGGVEATADAPSSAPAAVGHENEAPHPPIVGRMRPQWDTRRKRAAKAHTARETAISRPLSDDEGSAPKSPCPPPGVANC